MSEASGARLFWLQIQSLLNTINHILIILMALYFTVFARSLHFQDTAMHMFLTGIGFHCLIAEALMSHYRVNPITYRLSHRNKSRFHAIVQILGGSMVLLGALGKISQTELHFETLHGKIGAAATFMCSASLIGGLVNFFQPKLAHKLYPPSEIKYRHNLFGLLTFSLGMTAIFLSYSTQFFFKYVDTEFIRVLSLVTIFVYVFTAISPIGSLLDKRKYRVNRK